MYINILLDISIGLSMIIIAYYFHLFYRIKRNSMYNPTALLLFIIAITLGGLNRFFKAISRVYDHEWLVIFSDGILLIIVIMFISALPPMMRRILRFKTAKEYDDLMNELLKSLKEKSDMLQHVKEINHKLADRIQVIENTLYNQGWISEQQTKLNELRDIINQFRATYKIGVHPNE